MVDILDDMIIDKTSPDYTIKQTDRIEGVSKELFTGGPEIDLKSEVTKDQIVMITKLRFLQSKAALTNVQVLIDSFLTLSVSKDRKSRIEFIQAVNGETKKKDKNMLQRWFSNDKQNNP